MKLRKQFLSLSLAALLVPWFGWKLVQELEHFMRAGQESALQAAANTIASAVPVEFQSELLYGRDRVLALRQLSSAPHLDAYADDWPEPAKTDLFQSADGALELALMAARQGQQLFLYAAVTDHSPVRAAPPARNPADNPAPGQEQGSDLSDGLLLYVRSARGLISFRIHTAAPGPLNISSQTDGGGQLEGHWLDTPTGYQVELALPLMSTLQDISLGAVDVMDDGHGRRLMREAGTLDDTRPSSWLALAPENASLKRWLNELVPAGSRVWIVDQKGWVMADAGTPQPAEEQALSFAERWVYRAVAGARTELLEERAAQLVRLDDVQVRDALAGQQARHWAQDPESARVRHTVAVPLRISGEVRGAVVMETNTDGMLLVTNRALGRWLLSTLVLTLGLVAGLWYFATRLSRRVQKLSASVSAAMDSSGLGNKQPASALPLTADRDELGELARNNARLLRAVAEYTAYLQKLAGRLSHELKTPLAITRSSLDNLANHGLDPQGSTYLERAREGLDRQAAIVRAMSEATRLEAAVASAEWAAVDLGQLLKRCVDGYRAVHPARTIEYEQLGAAPHWHCAPDLLAQALDKLVDNALSLSGDKDAVTITLAATERECCIRVSNSGSRLPDVLPEQLFDSLVSMRETDTGRHLGLGLHIVRLVAEAHGGRVAARNLANGEGVVFELFLPANQTAH